MKIGDKVRVVKSTYGEDRPYTFLCPGDTGTVTGLLDTGVLLVYMDQGFYRTPFPGDSGWAFYEYELEVIE